MFKSLNPLIGGVALLGLVPAAWSSASAPATGAYASEVPREDIGNQDQTTLATDNEEQTIPVAEEIEYVKDNSFRKPFEESLKTVAKIDYYGTRYVDCGYYPLEVHTARPNQASLLVKTGDSSQFEASISKRGSKIRGTPQGLGVEEERALLETFNFDTPIAQLEKNQHALKPLGMQKLPGMLTWKLQVAHAGRGYQRILYVDSRYGDVVKFSIMNAQGTRVLDVGLRDYRAVEGIRVPFAIDYRSPDGTLLASDRIERVAVTRRGQSTPLAASSAYSTPASSAFRTARVRSRTPSLDRTLDT